VLRGLDLFSGIGGIAIALQRWVRPVAYCEIDAAAQKILARRILEGKLPAAPIWDDVRTLQAKDIGSPIEIIYGGFPCQDASVANCAGKGVDGERTGLVWHILRLATETKAPLVFLENVPGIRTRGAEAVGKALAKAGYDCRWDLFSAAEVGAPHLRKRWFLLAAHADRLDLRKQPDRFRDALADATSDRREQRLSFDGGGSERPREKGIRRCRPSVGSAFRNANGARLEERQSFEGDARPKLKAAVGTDWWAFEPDVGRVAHGVPNRVDRLRMLGNSVVPLQVELAFRELAGLRC
jgi:DNA (cytosine-5)-methyltransferase 1